MNKYIMWDMVDWAVAAGPWIEEKWDEATEAVEDIIEDV